MEKLVYCDTHVIVWLYANELSLFPRQAIKLMELNQLMISPAVILELEYLYEVGKIKVGSQKIFNELEKAIDLKICPQPFIKVIEESLKKSWTRDPFDRLITAQASIMKSSLLTRDETIHKNYPHAVWD